MIQPEVGPEPEQRRALAGELPTTTIYVGRLERVARDAPWYTNAMEASRIRTQPRGKRARTLSRSRVVIHAVEREKHDLTALSVKEPFYFYFGRTVMSIRSVCDR